MKFNATFEYLSGQKAAIIALFDSNGEWAGASRISHKGEGRKALYERGYNHASTMASLKGGSLDSYRTVASEGGGGRRTAKRKRSYSTRSKTTRSKPSRRKILGRARVRLHRHRRSKMVRTSLLVSDRVRVVAPDDAYAGHSGWVIAKTPKWVVVDIDGDKCDFKPSELQKI